MKLLGGGLGFAFGGPLGAILGFVLGSAADALADESVEPERHVGGEPKNATAREGDFQLSLLVLAAMVIKSDGRTEQRELDFVRAQFVHMFGAEKANESFRLFSELVRADMQPKPVCDQIRRHMAYAGRLQLVHFLFNIAKSDGHVNQAEVRFIAELAGYLYVTQQDFSSIAALFQEKEDPILLAYRVLEIPATATNEEVKRAYRKMAMKHHPDKVANLGEDAQKGAREKFLGIQEAYERIARSRGMS